LADDLAIAGDERLATLSSRRLDECVVSDDIRAMLSPDSLPLPPYHLATRTGGINDVSRFWSEWEEIGDVQAGIVRSYLPPDWSRPGRRTLDFGCGSGRTLRSFLRETEIWDMWGCDVHDESIEWLQEHLDPPFHFFTLGETPSIPKPDEYFDLVWAFSVFTHITEQWSDWLLEIHRTLKPEGLALISFLGQNMIGPLVGEEWDADRIGMNCVRVSQSWDIGGPTVFHSEWWLRAHWGRAFDILRLDDDHESSHGFILLRKRDVPVTRAGLIAFEADEPRENAALKYNLEQLHAEEGRLRQSLEEERDLRVRAEAAYNEAMEALVRERQKVD
jgi:SAM-dependent methyltransferase